MFAFSSWNATHCLVCCEAHDTPVACFTETAYLGMAQRTDYFILGISF